MDIGFNEDSFSENDTIGNSIEDDDQENLEPYNEDEEYEEYEPEDEENLPDDETQVPDEEIKEKQPEVENESLLDTFQQADESEIEERQYNDELEPDFFKEPADDGFLDLYDPYNDKKIATQKDQAEFLQRYSDNVLETAGLPAEYLDYRISTHPRVVEAKNLIESYEIEISNMKFLKEFDELKQILPTINEVEDLLNVKNFNKFFKNYFGTIKVDSKGNPISNPTPRMSLKDAYILANYNEMIKSKNKVARQAAINSFRNKKHLSTHNNSRFENSPMIPQETMELYQHLLPNLKPRDYLKHFKKNQENN